MAYNKAVFAQKTKKTAKVVTGLCRLHVFLHGICRFCRKELFHTQLFEG